MKYPKAGKKRRKTAEDRNCYFCKYAHNDGCPNKDKRRLLGGICDAFKWDSWARAN